MSRGSGLILDAGYDVNETTLDDMTALDIVGRGEFGFVVITPREPTIELLRARGGLTGAELRTARDGRSSEGCVLFVKTPPANSSLNGICCYQLPSDSYEIVADGQRSDQFGLI